MADLDNLDALSNAELRAKMIAQGLPNIPVTDSSRKVLVKRLRASLGGQAPSPAAATASPKKAGNRRETLQAASNPAPAAVEKPAPTKARRTIAAAATPSDEYKEKVAVPAKKPVTAAPIPVQTRRTSTSSRNPERSELVNERVVVKKPETIVEDIESTLEVNSLIILESDDEEDAQLIQAADKAEQQFARKEKAKLMTTATSTHEYISSQAAPLVNVAPVPVRNVAPAPVSSTATAAPRLGSSYDYLSSRTGRYTSYVSSPVQSYVTAEAVSSSYRHSPAPAATRHYPTEYSDDNDAEEDSQYESTFARNLARLRNEKIGDRSSPYNRRTIASSSSAAVGGLGSGYELRARRSLRPEDASVSVNLSRWLNSLEQKYKIKSKLFVLIVILVLFGVYHWFY